VSFDASSSKAREGGSIQKYEWDLDGDGSFETDTGATPSASRSYSSAQLLTVRLRVTDDNGVAEQKDGELRIDPASQPDSSGGSPGGGSPGGDSPGGDSPDDSAAKVPLKVRVLSSKRLRRIVRRGVRFEAAVPVTGATLRATMSVNGRKVGSVRGKGLSRGRVRVTLKLSRRGKARLTRLVAKRRRAKAVLKVAAGRETTLSRFTIRR